MLSPETLARYAVHIRAEARRPACTALPQLRALGGRAAAPPECSHPAVPGLVTFARCLPGLRVGVVCDWPAADVRQTAGCSWRKALPNQPSSLSAARPHAHHPPTHPPPTVSHPPDLPPWQVDKADKTPLEDDPAYAAAFVQVS